MSKYVTWCLTPTQPGQTLMKTRKSLKCKRRNKTIVKKQMPNRKAELQQELKRTIPKRMPCKLLKTGRQTRKDDETEKRCSEKP